MSVFGDSPSVAIDDLTGDYTLDLPHTHLGFMARHAMVTKVRGTFKQFEGHAHIDAADPSRSSVHVTIQVDSVDTGSEQRDGHLRTNDFFDVANYPEMTFHSTNVERNGDAFSVTGDLTIKDITKPVTIDFESTGSAKDPFGNMRVGFEGSVVVNRKDWNLVWNVALETGGFLVSDKIVLEFDVSAIKTPAS